MSNGLDHFFCHYGFDRLEPLAWELLCFFTVCSTTCRKNTVLPRVGLLCSFDLKIVFFKKKIDFTKKKIVVCIFSIITRTCCVSSAFQEYIYIYIYIIIIYIYIHHPTYHHTPSIYLCIYLTWLVVSTPLKHISHLGWLFPTYGNKNFQTTNQ